MKKKDSTQENLKAFEQGLTKAELLLEKNQNKLIIIVSSFVVLFSLFFAFKKFYKEPREMRAVNEIYLAERAFDTVRIFSYFLTSVLSDKTLLLISASFSALIIDCIFPYPKLIIPII